MPAVLEREPYHAKNKWQKIHLIICLIVLAGGIRQFFCCTVKCLINRCNATIPVAIPDISKTLQVVLLTYKIPHEITPVHPPELVVEEILDLIFHCWAFAFVNAAKFLVNETLITF